MADEVRDGRQLMENEGTCEFCGHEDAVKDEGVWICADCLDDSRWVQSLRAPAHPNYRYPQERVGDETV